MASERLIDDYLDELAGALRVELRRLRRILLEVEDHLRAAAAAHEAAGLAPAAAEAAAIARFGSPARVAAGFGPALSTRAWLFRGYLWAALLGATVLIAAGLGSLASAGLGALAGRSYVAGDPPGAAYTPARCTDFFEYYPGAADCEAAATAHHFDERISYGAAALALGLLAGAAHLALRRRFVRGESPRSLARRAFAVLGMVGFGAAGLVLAAYGALGAIRWPDAGYGFYLACAAVALGFFAAFLRPGLRSLGALVLEDR